jgi:hypothetical protein
MKTSPSGIARIEGGRGVSGAAAAVIVLDPTAGFAASVVRSGRFSGQGAFNAAAKELARRIAILRAMSG